MELEEMKSLWVEMSAEMEKQKKLTDSLIIKMTQADYRNKLNNILIPEALGSLACFIFALFFVLNFHQLSTWYLQACGVFSVVILVLLPVLSISTIYKMRATHIAANNYKQSLLEYSKSKMQFIAIQKLNIYLGAVLMVLVLPVMGKIIAGKDIFKATNLWYLYALIFPLFYGLSRWIFKKYMKTAADAESILKGLQD